MGNLYDIESFHKTLTGEYTENFHEAMNLVNATRDSVVADSLFIEEQSIEIYKKYLVDIYDNFLLNMIRHLVSRVFGEIQF